MAPRDARPTLDDLVQALQDRVIALALADPSDRRLFALALRAAEMGHERGIEPEDVPRGDVVVVN